MAAEPLRREPYEEHDFDRRRSLEAVTRRERPEGRPWTLGSFVLAALGFFLAPLIGGGLGILAGWQGLRKGDRLGRWAIAVNAFVVVLGVVLAVVLASG